jgi:alkanesulfonate monooxygenase SsuD/methylene tetrahydromethanopterin reductase-like flavin-dependent oxidoreductase (luciferase family)
MEFGLNFFPDVGPEEKSADQYWAEALHLTGLCDELGYSHVRTVEHYFHRYGGYSPNPLLYLAAASQRTRKARLVTGAILPVFNSPLKIAAEIAEVDAFSGGRLDVGFARAFLPHEFRRRERSLDESRARFDEGVEMVRRLLEEERVSMKGQFHSFEDVTSLPRPVQKPRPPFWLAASSTDESFVTCGRLGYGLMTFPRETKQLRHWLQLYRDSWRQAGHPGNGQVMIAFHMYCAPTDEKAIEFARDGVNAYIHSMVDANSEWGSVVSKDYPHHPKMIENLKKLNFEKLREGGGAWVGSPGWIRDKISWLHEAIGGFELASVQVNSHTMDVKSAEASMRLFAAEVMPQLKKL